MRKPLLLIILLSLALPIYAQEAFDPFPQNRGSIYEYDDPPDVCFFGQGARWNGYDITVSDWYKLTDYQKICFVSEAIDMLQIDVDNGWDILVMMNSGVDKLDPGFSMFIFLSMLLKPEAFDTPAS